MISDVHDLLSLVQQSTSERSAVNRLWLVEAVLTEAECELIHEAAGSGYIAINRQISSGSEYLDIGLTASGRVRLAHA